MRFTFRTIPFRSISIYPMGAVSNRFRMASLSTPPAGAGRRRWTAAGRRVRIRIHTSEATHSKPGRKAIHANYRQNRSYRIVLIRFTETRPEGSGLIRDQIDGSDSAPNVQMNRRLGVAKGIVNIPAVPPFQPRRVNASDATFHIGLDPNAGGRFRQINGRLADAPANAHRIVGLRHAP